MKTLLLHIPVHSIVDLITNSSSEIFMFMFNGSTQDETVKRLLKTIVQTNINGDSETSIDKYADYRYKNEYKLPDGINADDVYIANIDQNDYLVQEILKEFFVEIKPEYL